MMMKGVKNCFADLVCNGGTPPLSRTKVHQLLPFVKNDMLNFRGQALTIIICICRASSRPGAKIIIKIMIILIKIDNDNKEIKKSAEHPAGRGQVFLFAEDFNGNGFAK